MHSRQEMIDDLKKIIKIFREQNPNSKSIITRSFFRKNSSIKEAEYEKEFGDFETFKNSLDNSINKEFEKEKKIHHLEEENKSLKKDKETLLKRSLNEDKILDIYKHDIVQFFVPQPMKLTKVVNDSNKIAILNLSDFHASEVVLLNEINGINEYNLQIMKKRIDRVFYYFLYYCQKYSIKEIYILFLGDLLSGSIHPELIRTNETDDVDTLFILQEYIAKKIIEIESYFSKINCEFVVGNHSRIQQFGEKPQIKTSARINWEYILAKQLKLQFELLQKDQKQKIVINVNDSLFKVIEIAERKFFITHGHFMTGGGSGGFAGIPYYSLSMSSAKLYGALKQIGVTENLTFDDIIMGHLHTTSRMGLFNGGNLYINGCSIGTNEFSLYRMKTIAKKEQTMLIVQKGHVINEITLRCE